LKKSKILILSEYYPPIKNWLFDEGPPEGVPAIYNFYDYLGDRDDLTFTAICYNPIKNHIKTFPNGSSIELKKLSINSYYLWKIIVLLKTYRLGNSKMKKTKFHLVYGLSQFSFLAAKLGKKHKTPSVGRILGTLLTKVHSDKNYISLYTRHILDVLNIKIPCDEIICTFDGTAYDDVFPKFNKKRNPKLLFNGMDLKFREELLSFPNVKILPSKDTLKICYIARLEYYKRQELAIEMMSALSNKYQIKNAVLTIVGSGSKEKTLKKLVQERKLNKFVDFLPAIPHHKIPKYLDTQHIALFLYEGGSLGNALWESTLSGRLIGTVDNGSTAKIFQDNINGIVVSEDENIPTNLALRISELIGTDVSSMTKNGRDEVASKVKGWKERFDHEFDMLWKKFEIEN